MRSEGFPSALFEAGAGYPDPAACAHPGRYLYFDTAVADLKDAGCPAECLFQANGHLLLIGGGPP